MVIGLDLRSLPSDGSAGAGVAHAARFLSEALIAQDVPWEWNVYLHRNAHPVAEKTTKRIHAVKLDHADGASLRNALRAHPCDLLLELSGSIPPGLSVPTVPWVHDIAIFSHPEWFPQSWIKRAATTFLFKQGLKKAPFVFSVSNFTAGEIAEQLGYNPYKIHVTHEGGDPFLDALHGPSLEERKRKAKLRVGASGVTNAFMLVLGTVEPRKNIAFLMSAWRKASAAINRPLDLVIAGRDGWKLQDVHSALTRHIIPESDGSRVHRLYAVSDDERHDLLLAADLVAVPSHHEGFGLVALEAMQAGTAVIVSNGGALPEVVGEAGIVLDPTDYEGWSKAIAGLVNDEISRVDMALAAKARSQFFSWHKSARAVIEVLKNELYEQSNNR